MREVRLTSAPALLWETVAVKYETDDWSMVTADISIKAATRTIPALLYKTVRPLMDGLNANPGDLLTFSRFIHSRHRPTSLLFRADRCASYAVMPTGYAPAYSVRLSFTKAKIKESDLCPKLKTKPQKPSAPPSSESSTSSFFVSASGSQLQSDFQSEIAGRDLYVPPALEGEDLLKWRRHMRWNPKEAAAAMGLPPKVYRAMEQGEMTIRPAMSMICAAYASGLAPWPHVLTQTARLRPWDYNIKSVYGISVDNEKRRRYDGQIRIKRLRSRSRPSGSS